MSSPFCDKINPWVGLCCSQLWVSRTMRQCCVCPSTTSLVGHEPSIGHRKERITESAIVDGVIEICGCRPRPPESNPFEATSPVDVVVVRVELAQGVGIHDVNDGVFSGLQG